MRTLHQRIDRLRAAMPPRASLDGQAIGEALDALWGALLAHFPHPRPVYVPSPYSHGLLLASVQPPGQLEQARSWGRRVAAGDATEADDAISLTLPGWALARINLTVTRFAALFAGVDEFC